MFTDTNDIYIGRAEEKPNKVFDLKCGAVLVYGATVSVFINELKIDLNIDQSHIIDACECYGSVFILCSTDKKLIIHEIDKDSYYRKYILNIPIGKNIIFDACRYLYIKSDYVIYILDPKSSNIYDENYKATKLPSRLGGYTINPSNDKNYITMRILDMYNITLECNDMFIINEKILLPVTGTSDAVLIDKDINIVTIENIVFDKCDFYIVLGNEEFEDYGSVFLISHKGSLITIDLQDFIATPVLSEFSNISFTRINDDIYYLIDGKLILIDNYQDSFLINTNISGIYTVFSKNNELYYYNNLYCYKLEKCTDKATISIFCKDMHGDIIKVDSSTVKKENTIRVNAPIIDSYVLDGEEAYIDIQTSPSDEFYTAEFSYKLHKEVYTVTCTHKTSDESLMVQSMSGFIGEKYSFCHEVFQGYSFSHSVNAKGVYGDKKDAYIYYVSSKDINNCIVDIHVKSDKSSINRNIHVNKNSTKIIPVDIPFHKPKATSVAFSRTNDLNFIDIEYVPENECKPCSYIYSGIDIMDSFCMVKEDILYFEEDLFLIENDIKKTTLSKELIHVYPKNNITLTRFIDVFNGKVISKMINLNESLIDSNISIENYRFSKKEVSSYDKMKVCDLFYGKINTSLTIHYIDADSLDNLLESVTIHGNTFSSIKHDIPKIDGYSSKDKSVVIEFKNDHYDYFIKYYKKFETITYNYIDIHSKNIIKTETYRLGDYAESMPKESMSYIFSEVTGNCSSGEYSIFCDDSYGPVIYNDNYEHGYNLIDIKSSNMFEQRLISVIDDVDNNNPVYIISPASDHTRKLLTDNNIDFEVVDAVPNNECVLIDGCIENHSSSMLCNMPCNVLYIPCHVHYKNIIATINMCRKSVINKAKIKYIPKTNVDIDINIDAKSVNLLGDVNLECIVTHKTREMTSKKLNILSPVDLKNVYSSDISLNTTPKFNQISYSINGGGQDITTNDVITLKTNNKVLIPLIMTIGATDLIGNTSLEKEIYKEIYIKNIHQVHVPKIKYRPSIARVNNRKYGVKESMKYINTFDGLDRAIDDIENIINKNKVEY